MPYSHVSIAITNTIVASSIRTDSGRFFKIIYNGKDTHIIQEIDESKLPQENTPLEPEIPQVIKEFNNKSKSKAQSKSPRSDSGNIIDIMIVYTSAARQAAGGTSAIQSIINSSVATMNTTFANSNINPRVRLVHTVETSYSRGETDTTSGFNTALYDITGTDDGYMDNIHTLRDTYHADMVQLLFNNDSSAGLAWIMTSPSAAFETHAFSVVHYSQADGWAFDHEMGHNMGMVHDRANTNSEGSFSYSYGYQSPSNSWHTVMAYACAGGCPRIDYWSNPAKVYDGEATGVAIGQPEEADARSTINNNAGIIANWRVSSVQTDKPDLLIQSISVSSTSLTTGQSYTIYSTVKNQGEASSDSTTLRYYISTDSTISTSDTYLSLDAVSGLATSETSSEQSYQVAPNAEGVYYIGTCVDSVNEESDTSNNCSAGVQIIVNAEHPDLLVQSVSINDDSITTAESFSITAIVKNQGDASSNSTTLRYYVSTDSTISTSDTYLSADSISALSAGSTVTKQGVQSALAVAGIYYIGACVDSVNNESNIGNNCSSGAMLVVVEADTD
ncbi:MAG TPA: hypothetical protein EYP22_02555, partial [Methanosarcinales archaeon]|nr:hypothetical protein [Methanosarcinales archaeon]